MIALPPLDPGGRGEGDREEEGEDDGFSSAGEWPGRGGGGAVLGLGGRVPTDKNYYKFTCIKYTLYRVLMRQ